MIEIRRILCPIDFSDASRHALDHAAAIAKWYESHLTALHVISPPFVGQPPILFAEPASTAATPTGREREAFDDELRAWVEPAVKTGVKADTLLDEGNPAARILAHASALPADLIVMGTHGLAGFERFMLGSVTEKVLRKAACPVMTVPPAAVAPARAPYTRVLCPVDFSPSSLSALQFAISIAEESDAHLTLLHVLDWPTDDDLLERFEAPETLRVIENETRNRLEGLISEEVRVYCKPSTRIARGKPYRQILEVADNEGADLIMLGVRGRNPVDLALFGSTTNHVVRRASCPVLTLKQ